MLHSPHFGPFPLQVVGTEFVPSAASGKYTSRFSRYISLPGPNTDDSGLAKKTVTNLIEIAPVATFTWPPTAEEDAPMEDKLYELAPGSPKPLPSSTFTWPPTAEENRLIEGKLYGPSCQRRLPVFCQICAQWDTTHLVLLPVITTHYSILTHTNSIISEYRD